MDIKILSLTTNLSRFGGAQKVLVDVHEGIREKYDAKILGFQKFESLLTKYNIQEKEYVRLTNPFYLNNKILIVHARNVMAFIMVLKWVFFLNTKILYVSHNVYNTHRGISFFPKNIISISKKVTDNLINYFKLKNKKIQLIYNGIKDESLADQLLTYRKNNKINILYSARVNAVKRQLQIVDQLAGKLLPEIEICFAGSGPDIKQLYEKCKNLVNFKVLGFVENMNELVRNADYLMLYSIQEGLPISLIEGTMHAKPLLVNDVGGNLEIGKPGLNGFQLTEDWDMLANTLNGLTSISKENYKQMCINSRNRYEEMFTYNKMIEKYIKVIESF